MVDVKCDVGDSFLYHRYCCKDSRGQDDCFMMTESDELINIHSTILEASCHYCLCYHRCVNSNLDIELCIWIM
ncbi:hypothetical protein KSF78_0004357 [Schistosoma japonicum]|nr:hypothetical protein KSF78_0004357 [Schistosoma japonicum]